MISIGNFQGLVNFIDKIELTYQDAIIVCGDMGICWRKDKKDMESFVNWYEDRYDVNIYFVDGNHENFDILDTLDIDEKNMKIISPHIHMLQRGCVYNIQDKTILAIGGADSVDKFRRIPHLSWWKQEQITQEDIDRAIRAAAGIKIDYVISHTCPRSVLNENKIYLCDFLDKDESFDHTSEDRLEELMSKIDFDHSFFGHYHKDIDLNDKFTCLYRTFREL